LIKLRSSHKTLFIPKSFREFNTQINFQLKTPFSQHF
jgi:hypothetical protein